MKSYELQMFQMSKIAFKLGTERKNLYFSCYSLSFEVQWQAADIV